MQDKDNAIFLREEQKMQINDGNDDMEQAKEEILREIARLKIKKLESLERVKEAAEKCKVLFKNIPEVKDVKAGIIRSRVRTINPCINIVVNNNYDKNFYYYHKIFPQEVDGIELVILKPNGSYFSLKIEK